MKKTTPYNLTSEDVSWISQKINSTYMGIKKSEFLTPDEKRVEINILVMRAYRMGLKETVDRLGYNVFEIPLGGEDRSAELLLPKDTSSKDLQILSKRIEMLNPDFLKESTMPEIAYPFEIHDTKQ